MTRRSIWLPVLIGLALASFTAAGAWLLLRGGAPEEAPAIANETRSAAPAVKSLPAPAQLDLAFRAAFGGQARRAVGDQTFSYAPERLEWIGERAALISLGTNSETCHACGGAMAIHYLVPEGGGLRVAGAWLEAGPSGSYGAPPHEVAINRELADHPVVYSASGYTGQGYTCTVAWLVELRPEGPVGSEPIPIAYSNAGAILPESGRTMGGDPLREIEGRIANVRSNQSFDVAFTGAERFVDTYVYRNNRFVRRTAESRAAC